MDSENSIVIFRDLLKLKVEMVHQIQKFQPNFSVHHLVDVIFFTFPIDELKMIVGKLSTMDRNKNIAFTNDLKKILVTKNQLQNLDAHPIGLETSISFYSTNAQSILSVKHITKKNEKHQEQIFPNLNITLLHTGRDWSWFRIRTSMFPKILVELKKTKFLFTHISLNNEIFEIYFPKDNGELRIYQTMKLIFDDLVDEIIFYSNCKLVIENENIFIIGYSNAFKFYYCYLQKTHDTVVTSSDYYFILELQLHCFILTTQYNFNTNKGLLLQPLSNVSGEKCIPTLRSQSNQIFYTGGPRDGLIIGNGVHLGANSKIELVCQIKDEN